jgi:hypothetical protein
MNEKQRRRRRGFLFYELGRQTETSHPRPTAGGLDSASRERSADPERLNSLGKNNVWLNVDRRPFDMPKVVKRV